LILKFFKGFPDTVLAQVMHQLGFLAHGAGHNVLHRFLPFVSHSQTLAIPNLLDKHRRLFFLEKNQTFLLWVVLCLGTAMRMPESQSRNRVVRDGAATFHCGKSPAKRDRDCVRANGIDMFQFNLKAKDFRLLSNKSRTDSK
jgi:hypothetical protein